MKNFLVIGIIVTLLAVSIAPVFAANNPGEKLTRGVASIVTAALEVPKQIDVEWKAASQANDNVAVGVLAGIFKGLAFTVGRLGSGAWDIVSFPFKVPANFEPVMKPDYIFDKK